MRRTTAGTGILILKICYTFTMAEEENKLDRGEKARLISEIQEMYPGLSQSKAFLRVLRNKAQMDGLDPEEKEWVRKKAGEKEDRAPLDFVLVPSILIRNKNISALDALIYGVIYYYTQINSQELCTASNKTIAKTADCTPGSVSNAITRLKEEKFITVYLDKNNHRLGIEDHVRFTRRNKR